MQQGAGRLVEHQPGQPGGGQPVDDPALSWLAHGGGDDAEHSEISRSREISRDLDSFFLARPRDFERKYLALVSNSEMFRKKSRSRLEL